MRGIILISTYVYTEKEKGRARNTNEFLFRGSVFVLLCSLSDASDSTFGFS